MNAKNRLDKLLETARTMALKRGQAIRRRQCQNATMEELVRMVTEAVPDESEQVFLDIVKQVEEYLERPPRELADGELAYPIHGFMYWLWGLQAGSSSLPEKLPHKLLLAWRNGHAGHPAGASPVPIRRCEACLLVLPNCTIDGHGPCLTPCPACGSDNISHKKLSGNDWDGRDPMWVYTPLPTSLKNAGTLK
jgi:hypothetical protein